MTELQNKVLIISEELLALKKSDSVHPICTVEKFDDECLLSCNRAALLQIAQRLLSLHSKVEGSHFTIDEADIALTADISITISVRDDIECAGNMKAQ